MAFGRRSGISCGREDRRCSSFALSLVWRADWRGGRGRIALCFLARFGALSSSIVVRGRARASIPAKELFHRAGTFGVSLQLLRREDFRFFRDFLASLMFSHFQNFAFTRGPPFPPPVPPISPPPLLSLHLLHPPPTHPTFSPAPPPPPPSLPSASPARSENLFSASGATALAPVLARLLALRDLHLG